ncbi:MAG: ATP-binding protein [Gammaproteobacteria bacterium]|jgi:predicted AAA+ superfamily ATPase
MPVNYQRIIKDQIASQFFQGKAIIIVGARQAGKTTLCNELIEQLIDTVQKFNGDNPKDRNLLENRDLDFLINLIGDKKIIFIDEGQKIKTIGQTIKLLVDHYGSKKQILVTGSSSINLLNHVQEALTGRKYVHILHPLSMQEIYSKNKLALLQNLQNYMIFGCYPEIVTTSSFEAKTSLLKELTDSYLFKDILEFQQIRNSTVLKDLLRALAFQIGSEASYTELSNLLGIDKKTVERYIDLLEKNFVIFRLAPYKKKRRREISKLRKIFFYDLGIRNAIINNFNHLDARNDTGILWENFIISERLKYREYNKIYANQYFWRTYDGSEVDLIEEREGNLFGYEFKWNEKKKRNKTPQSWLEYQNSSYQCITKKDLFGFII